MRQLFLDTETTGLDPATGDRVIELACVEMVGRRLTGTNLHHYVNPERKSSEDALRIHGLTDEFLADKPKFAAIADEFLAYVQGAELIIHNAGFDVAFLDMELQRIGRPPLRRHVAAITDSLAMAREMFPGKANSLDALCRRLEVDLSTRTLHGALVDCALLSEVYIRMTRGQKLLVVDGHDGGAAGGPQAPLIDLRQFELPVLLATDDERAAHEAVLAELDKASGGKTIWRNLVA